MAKIFFSYSHRDEALRDELEKHLSTIRRQGFIEAWHDRRIVAGAELAHKISQNLEIADVILLLVSSDFLASDYCYDVEMKRAMERHAAGEARVIPVILRPCDWQDAPFGKLLATPPDGKPVTRFPTLDDAFVLVVADIKMALRQMGQEKAPMQPAAVMTEAQPALKEAAKPRSSNLRIRKEFSDRDFDKFLAESYEFIANFFEGSLQELERRNPDIETDFRRIDANHFTAKIYRKGKQKCGCKIWHGSRRGVVGGIAYRGNGGLHDYMDDSSFNEAMNVENDGYALFLKPLGMAHLGWGRDQMLTQEGAAEYFWGLFVAPLQR
ncbi:MAG: toll/interleukin-1 receptor domain-containing protein [Syntrophotaleaceae bacterium]